MICICDTCGWYVVYFMCLMLVIPQVVLDGKPDWSTRPLERDQISMTAHLVLLKLEMPHQYEYFSVIDSTRNALCM